MWAGPRRRFSGTFLSFITRRGAKAIPTVGSSKHEASVRRAPGSSQSSPCTNWTQRPRACSRHSLWFPQRPSRVSLLISRSPGRSSAAAMAAQPSGESSSTTTISKSTPSCSKMLRRQRSMVALLLYIGTHTEIAGIAAFSSASSALTDTTPAQQPFPSVSEPVALGCDCRVAEA